MGTNGDLQLSINQISAWTVSFLGCIEQPSALANSIHDNTNLTWHRKNHYSVGKNSESAYFAYFSFQGGGVFHEKMVPRLHPWAEECLGEQAMKQFLFTRFENNLDMKMFPTAQTQNKPF